MAMISKDEMLARVVDPILEAMKEGKLLWLQGWNVGAGAGLPYNPTKASNKQAYRGAVNNILMWFASAANGWGDPRWMGFAQAKTKGWRVRKGEESTQIYAPIMGSYPIEENGQKVWRKYVKGFNPVHVFNAQQVDGIPAIEKAGTLDVSTGYAAAEDMYKAMNVQTIHGGNVAAYAYQVDIIRMPEPEMFVGADEYHATRLHEMGHATGHPSRMDRRMFGTGLQDYAQEELVAELFAAFACADIGVSKAEMTQNHAAYLKSWHERLSREPKAFIDAVSAAWEAFEFVRKL